MADPKKPAPLPEPGDRPADEAINRPSDAPSPLSPNRLPPVGKAPPAAAREVRPEELPRTGHRADSPRMKVEDLPPEAFSSPAPPVSVDVVPSAVTALRDEPGGPVAEVRPPDAPDGDRRKYAEELLKLRQAAERGEDIDHQRLSDLHFLVNGQEPPKR